MVEVYKNRNLFRVGKKFCEPSRIEEFHPVAFNKKYSKPACSKVIDNFFFSPPLLFFPPAVLTRRATTEKLHRSSVLSVSQIMAHVSMNFKFVQLLNISSKIIVFRIATNGLRKINENFLN